MKHLILFVVSILLSIGLIATLNGSEYIGFGGVLERVSAIDFSFSESAQQVSEIGRNFDEVFDGTEPSDEETFRKKVVAFFSGLWACLELPIVFIREMCDMIYYVFQLLFDLVGVF